MKADAREAFNTSNVVGNYLNIYFGQEQGVRLGESSVVSLKAHQVTDRKGHVKILTNRDAGQKYLDFIDPNQVVHLDVFHQPGIVNPKQVAKRIFWAIEDYLIEEDPKLGFMEEIKFKNAVDYALKIEVVTRSGKGTVYDLFQGQAEPVDEEDERINRVRILMKLSSDKYGIILPIAAAVEDEIIEGGLELAKVKRITHSKEKEQEEDFAGYLIFPWKRLKNVNYQTLKGNQNQLLMKLAERFGSVKELEDFLEGYSANIFKRRSQEEQKSKWGDLEHHLDQMEELGIMKKTLLGPLLTKDGQELKEYLINHKCELEAEMRRSIRRVPRGSGRYHKIGESNNKISRLEFTNRNKVIRIKDNTWSGDLAVPETIIQAKKSSLLRNEDRLNIRKEDLHVYSKRSYIPMDICILIDASASMAGEKRQAACYLAEHLLLTGREKVAVVTFQEMNAQVVVPFTRNQQVLNKGLRSIRPAGLTPLADGLVTSVELIRNTRLENPVLILITDGMPNFPLWSFDAKQDAIEAAHKIAENKINFICIGVESNKDYLRDLAEVGQGKLYVVDDLNRNNLIDIMRYERKATMS